jgi:hypothetical protein
MKKIQDRWAEVEAMLVSANAPEHERHALRSIFYAGAVALLNLQEAAYEEAKTVNEGVEGMTALSIELTEFLRETENEKI